jgi:hypothetical protein
MKVDPPIIARRFNMLELREALEASWDEATSYGCVSEAGNPALGQCYPTSWVVQQFYPEVEIVEGEVWTRSIFGISCYPRGTNTTSIFRGGSSPLDQQFAVSGFETERLWTMDRRRLNDVSCYSKESQLIFWQ